MGANHLICPACSRAVARTDNFCSACGHALSGTAGADSARARPAAGTGMHGNVPRAAVQSPPAVAQNAFATIMFLDVKGSSTMIEGLDPEAAAELLDGIHDRFARYVHRFGGHIVNFQGDGFLAIFGAPEAQEDHAVRALLAAVAIREETSRESADDALAVRIGVHSGDVFTRQVRTDFALDFDAMGLTVHIAKRLEEAADDNGIRTSHATYRLARHQFEFENLGPVALRGLTHTIQAFRVLGFRRAVETDPIGDSGLQPAVGRDRELSRLTWSLGEAMAGRGQAVVLLGEAGIGKSRLAQEVAELAAGQGAAVLVHEEVMQGLSYSCSAVSRIVRYLEAMARAGAGSPDARIFHDRHDVIYPPREQDGEGHAAGDGDGAREPAVAVAGSEDELPAHFTRTIERLAGQQPLVLIIDDAQWVDQESLRMILQAAVRFGGLRVLVLICGRDFDSLPHFRDMGNISFIRVGPLPQEQCFALFRRLTRGASPPPALEPAVASVTGGNPLYIEELALASSTGTFDEAGAAEFLAGRRIEPTGRIRSLVLDRIHHLDDDARLALQAASLVQFDCLPDLLAEVAGIDDADRADRAVHTLSASGYLRRSHVGGQFLYGVRHSLLRQIIERSIVRLERRRLHGRVRDALGRSERPGISPEILAHHATLAEDWERASGDWREAGVRALDASLYRHAATCLEHALDASAHERDNVRRSQRQNEIRMLLRMCLAPTGEYQRLYFHLNQVSQVESAAVDANSRLQLLLSLAHVENICGNVRLSRAKAAEARLLAERAGQRGAHVAASYFLAQALEFGADYAGCVELCATTLADLGPSARHERFQLTGTSSVLFSSLSAHAHAFLDNHAEAERHGRLAVEVAQETQRPFDLGVASFGLGWARFVTGDLRGAMGCFETAMANVRDHRLQLLESMIDCRLRYLRIVVGGEAPDVVQPEQACREAAAMPHIRCWANLLWAMAEMHAGRLDRAARIVDDAIPVARARHYRGNLAWAYAVLAEIRWRASAPDRHVIGHRARQLLEKTGLAWKFADAAWMARDLAA